MKQSRLLFAPPLRAFAALIATPVLSQHLRKTPRTPAAFPPDGDQKSLSQTLDDCNGVIKPPKVGDSELVEPAPDVGKSRLIRPGDLPAQQSGADAPPQTGNDETPPQKGRSFQLELSTALHLRVERRPGSSTTPSC